MKMLLVHQLRLGSVLTLSIKKWTLKGILREKPFS